MRIKVMPDFLSSGLWDENGANITVPEYISDEDRILLEIWHNHWEIVNHEIFMAAHRESTPISQQAIERLDPWFDKFTTEVVARLNSYEQDEFFSES